MSNPRAKSSGECSFRFFTHYSYFLSSMNKLPANPPSWRNDTVLPLPMEVNANAWAVDAACSGNPGPMEYQCIDLQTGAQVFHYGPLHGTNNIGEFLAIVHALALMEQRGITDKVIYSDSVNAQYGGVPFKTHNTVGTEETMQDQAGTQRAD